MHNQVNKSLGKALFDCAAIGDFYDCGCVEDEARGEGGGKKEAAGGKKEEGGGKKEAVS